MVPRLNSFSGPSNTMCIPCLWQARDPKTILSSGLKKNAWSRRSSPTTSSTSWPNRAQKMSPWKVPRTGAMGIWCIWRPGCLPNTKDPSMNWPWPFIPPLPFVGGPSKKPRHSSNPMKGMPERTMLDFWGGLLHWGAPIT